VPAGRIRSMSVSRERVLELFPRLLRAVEPPDGPASDPARRLGRPPPPVEVDGRRSGVQVFRRSGLRRWSVAALAGDLLCLYCLSSHLAYRRTSEPTSRIEAGTDLNA